MFGFFGPDSTSTADYRTSLLNGSYLWSYGAGGGWYEGAGGISTTQNMAVDSLQGIFTFYSAVILEIGIVLIISCVQL